MSIYVYIFLTTCTRDHHITIIIPVLIETRDEQSHVDKDEYRNKSDVDVIVLHVWFCELIWTKGRKRSQNGTLFWFWLRWYQPSIYAAIFFMFNTCFESVTIQNLL